MQVVINQMENQIAEAKKLVAAVKGNVEARILYENCPLCESNNIIKSVIGDCSKQRLYNPIIPTIMQWMNCEDCHHQFINGYFTNEALEVILSKQPEEQVVGYEVEKQRYVSARIIEKILPLIFDFAQLNEFIDVPVKRFSTGMEARLSFSMGIYLPSDILLLDELLATIDGKFREKCINKLASDDFNKTLIFVSHNLDLVKRICNRGVVLNNGRMIYVGNISNSIER